MAVSNWNGEHHPAGFDPWGGAVDDDGGEYMYHLVI